MNNFNNKKLLFVVNVDWFFLSHRLPIALAAQQAGYEVHVATGLTNHFNELVEKGFYFHPLDLERGSNGLISIFREFLQIVKVMRSVRPDIVHLVTIKPVLFGGLASRIIKVPAMVAAISGLGYVFVAEGLNAKLRRFAIGFLYRLALGHQNLKLIFQNNEDQIRVIGLANLSLNNAALIRGSGVDLEVYSPSVLQDGPPVVMLPARLLVDKGVLEFIESVKLIKSRSSNHKNVRFVLVGDIDLQNPSSLTTKQISEIKKEALVEVWGRRNDMATVLSIATIVVLPSYREGLPKVLIEAAACGRVVITTDVPGCRDAIEPGVTGVLVPVKNSMALADAIELLLNDKDRCNEMGRAGRQFAKREFDINDVVNKHLNIYQELLSRIQV